MAAGALTLPLAAAARPYLYMASYDYSGSYQACLASAEKLLRQKGFARDLQVSQDSDQKGGLVYAFHNSEAVMAEIQCLQRPGISLLGVAGLNAATTLQLFEDLKTSTW